jgi:hypothetical protein
VPTFLVPATQKVGCTSMNDLLIFCCGGIWLALQVWMDLYTLPVPGGNGKTCSQIFEEAGCDTPANPNCGACLGGPRDTYARMNVPQVCDLLAGLIKSYRC